MDITRDSIIVGSLKQALQTEDRWNCPFHTKKIGFKSVIPHWQEKETQKFEFDFTITRTFI